MCDNVFEMWGYLIPKFSRSSQIVNSRFSGCGQYSGQPGLQLCIEPFGELNNIEFFGADFPPSTCSIHSQYIVHLCPHH